MSEMLAPIRVVFYPKVGGSKFFGNVGTHVHMHTFVSCVLLLILSCLVCNCCWLTVCIVVAVLCVLLSYVYLLYYVGIAVFYFR